jgi:hypothetical protein
MGKPLPFDLQWNEIVSLQTKEGLGLREDLVLHSFPLPEDGSLVGPPRGLAWGLRSEKCSKK